MLNKLDLKDRKILYQLDVNARQSNTSLARKVGVSKDIVNYRIKKLEKEGFIKGYYTVIDFSRLGVFSVRVYLNLMDADPKKENEIIDHLVNHQNVFFVAKTDGTTDIALGTWIRNIYEFENFYNDFKKCFKNYIKEEQISIFTRTTHYHRAYLLGIKDESEAEYFGGEVRVEYDEVDLKILRLLAKNSRVSVIEISQKTSIPARTVAYRIKQLEKKKIIQGYRIIFDFTKIGYEYYKVDLTLRDTNRLEQLREYIRNNQNILYIDETIGGSDFEFDIEVQGHNHFLKLINDMRQLFPEIRYLKYFKLLSYEKLLYFPTD